MDIFRELLSNRILISGCLAWFTAQVLKLLIHWRVHKKLDWTRLFGDGGMPSGHSATVTAMAVRSGILYGAGSFEFAVTALLAIIVMHDAMGVRLETGKQAVIIKEIVQLLEALGQDVTNEEKLKEFVGHTPSQVVAGALLGICTALLCP
ncbi:MAG: divergent PAP2 family protein [Lachnospiraceae bacterium]|jgi:acid phosphatase family membrane protein YuiD|nr:divergent PAP2 family protein [Lachnospiraceae bacterium]